jgi:uncharacterized protein (TIGR02145 family)
LTYNGDGEERINPMRKLLLTTAAVAAAIGLAFAGEPSFGTFTDTRDGQTYKTVTIGKQIWMAQNLNYKTKGGSWCYEDSLSYCRKYGRLYNWNAAKKACPAGYHLPSRNEWDILDKAVGGERVADKKLKSKSGWNRIDDNNASGNGTDVFGFSALPGGCRFYAGGFYHASGYGYWWSTWESNVSDGYAGYREMGGDDGYGCIPECLYNKDFGYSVRCVADRP